MSLLNWSNRERQIAAFERDCRRKSEARSRGDVSKSFSCTNGLVEREQARSYLSVLRSVDQALQPSRLVSRVTFVRDANTSTGGNSVCETGADSSVADEYERDLEGNLQRLLGCA